MQQQILHHFYTNMYLLIYMSATNTIRQTTPSLPPPESSGSLNSALQTNLLPEYSPGFEKPRCLGWLFTYKNSESKKDKAVWVTSTSLII